MDLRSVGLGALGAVLLALAVWIRSVMQRRSRSVADAERLIQEREAARYEALAPRERVEAVAAHEEAEEAITEVTEAAASPERLQMLADLANRRGG